MAFKRLKGKAAAFRAMRTAWDRGARTEAQMRKALAADGFDPSDILEMLQKWFAIFKQFMDLLKIFT